MNFKEIADRVPILDAANFLGLEVKQYRSPCPQCNRGGDRALQFFTDTQRFKCWGAEDKTWGDSVYLVAHVRGIEQTAAARELAKHFGLEKPGEKKSDTFDVEKYRSTLHYTHALLDQAGLTEDLARELGVGVSLKGTHQNKLVVPLYKRDGTFYAYASADALKMPRVKG